MFENFLGDEARLNNREVYIVTGVAGNKGTLKNEGKVVIPVSTWKVAVLLPRDQGLESIRDYRDLEVIAVNMPNEPGVRNVDWAEYLTTVDAIEALSGYDLLALLPDEVEARRREQHAAAARGHRRADGTQRGRRGHLQRGLLDRSEWLDRRLTRGASATVRPARARPPRMHLRRTASTS